MRPRSLTPYFVQALMLLLALVPIFANVFLHGDLLVPASFIFDVPPWSYHKPDDLPPQNPLAQEVPVSVCIWYKMTDEAFDRGEWPLWNPLQFTGAPLLGNFQSAVFYPPRLLFRLTHNTYVSLTVYVIFRMWLCGFSAFVAARILGLRTPFANLFSFAYMLTGYNLVWAMYPPPDVMAWLPLLFASVESLLASRYKRGLALMTIGMTLSILAGHPSSLMMGCTGLGMYAVLRLAFARGPVRHLLRCLAYATIAMTLSAAICAAQLLPFIEYMPEMKLLIYRLVPEGAPFYKFSIFDLMTAWNPRLLGTEFEGTYWGSTNHTYLGMLYLGITTWICASLLLGPLKLPQSLRNLVVGLVPAAIICTYCATDFPGADLVQGLPIISGSRPAYFLAFPSLAVLLIAAFALQEWMGKERHARDLAYPTAATAVSFIIVLAGLATASYLSSEYSSALHAYPGLQTYIAKQCLLTVLVGLATLTVLWWHTRRPRHTQVLGLLLCAILVADQAVGIRGLFGASPSRYVFPESKLIDFLQSHPSPCRIRIDTTPIRHAYLSLYGLEEPTGYDAIYPRRMKPYLDDLNTQPGSPVDALMANAYTLLPESEAIPDGFVKVAAMEGITVTQNPASMPRARLVDSIQVFPASQAMFAKMNLPDFDPRATVYTDEPIDFALPPADGSPAGECEITDWQSQSVTIRADAKKECVLVLADGYYPGWEATIDGAPAKIFPAYHLFRGVHLPPGQHTVEFHYRPTSFRYGLFISFLGLAASAICALIAMRKSRST